jgi:Uncharacterized protein conserved in bacteria (DUF2321)/REase_DpnII-MboI
MLTASQDRMLVCRAGHLITDRLTSRPDLRLPRCDRCGADTLDRCDTCGTLLAGALPVHGLDPIGSRPPRVCTTCGAAFPWALLPEPSSDNPLAKLEHLLRRLPRVARELRPASELDALVRALLPIHFDDVRPEARTPRYAAGNCTALVLPEIEAVVVPHVVCSGIGEAELTRRRAEDVGYCRGRFRTLVFFVFDPERRLPERLEAVWSQPEGKSKVRCIVAT